MWKSPSGSSLGNGTKDASDDPYLAYPSSNDTELLVSKPAVVNLGSRSSKCIRINPPPGPAKLSLIDDKRPVHGGTSTFLKDRAEERSVYPHQS